MTAVEPREVIDLVERYVDRSIADAERYQNSRLLDANGVDELHRTAQQVYALGVKDGATQELLRAVGAERRCRERVEVREEAELSPREKILAEVASSYTGDEAPSGASLDGIIDTAFNVARSAAGMYRGREVRKRDNLLTAISLLTAVIERIDTADE